MARQQQDQKAQEKLGGKGKKEDIDQEEDLSIEDESDLDDIDDDEPGKDSRTWN
jgi:hypothetical protein